MARAHAANASVQSDSIKGLAQSIANPASHRLLIAEPALRRAVPTLIIAFLVTICLGAFVQVIDQTRQKRTTMKRDIVALADIVSERLERLTATPPERAAAPLDAAGAAATDRPPRGLPAGPHSRLGQRLRPPRHRRRRRSAHPRPRAG